jgi:hypothetical protein
MNKALVKQIFAKPRMPKRPSASVTNTGTTYRATKAQTVLLRARTRIERQNVHEINYLQYAN